MSRCFVKQNLTEHVFNRCLTVAARERDYGCLAAMPPVICQRRHCLLTIVDNYLRNIAINFIFDQRGDSAIPQPADTTQKASS